MNTLNINPHLPIFPLPVFLLPGGITRLRIFEQRYLKMIQIASKGSGFVIVSNSINSTKESKESTVATPDDEWGSWVDIINFDQGDDGVLEVDVKCKNLVQLLSIDKDEDNLHFGEVKISSHWSQSEIKTENISLFHSLVSVFEQSPLLESLYKDDMTANTHWVIARWLEILPINLEVKTLFSKDDSFQTAQEFVHSIVLSNKKQ
ncbi:MAG: Lon protease-like protein [Colwellia sp.]|jgi:Lon protease-like protein